MIFMLQSRIRPKTLITKVDQIFVILFVTRLVAGFTNSYIIKKSLNHRCFGAWGHTLNGNEVRGGQGLRAIEYHWVGDYLA